MRPSRSTRKADDRAARVHIPVRRAHAGERRDQINPAVVRERSRQRFRLRRGRNQLHFVPQPLNRRARHEHAALQRVGRLAVHAPSDGGQQPRLTANRPRAGVHQHETARAIGILGLARAKACLPIQCRVLVARHRRNGNFASKDGLIQHADHARRIDDRRQKRRGNVHRAQKHLVPLLLVNVEQHRARRVRRVGHMHAPARQAIRQKAVHGAEAQLPVLRPVARTVDAVKQPFELRSGKVRVRNQSRAVADGVAQTVLLQALDQRRGAAALPHDRVVQRPARLSFPQKRRLALVGDAHGQNVRRVDPRLLHRRAQRVQLTFVNVLRVVLDPAGLGINLPELNAVRRHKRAVFIKHDRARARRSLIQCHDVFHQNASCRRNFVPSVTQFSVNRSVIFPCPPASTLSAA